jgi:hypothetical protein
MKNKRTVFKINQVKSSLLNTLQSSKSVIRDFITKLY